MVSIVLLVEVSFHFYLIAEFKFTPETYLTTPKLSKCVFFSKHTTHLLQKSLTFEKAK